MVREENRVSCSGHLTPEIGSATKQRHLLLSSGVLPYTYVVYLYIIHPGDYQSVLHRSDYICRNWRILWIINDGLCCVDMHFSEFFFTLYYSKCTVFPFPLIPFFLFLYYLTFFVIYLYLIEFTCTLRDLTNTYTFHLSNALTFIVKHNHLEIK